MKRKFWIGGGVLLILATAGYGFSWWTAYRYVETTDDAYVGADITVISPKVTGYIGTLAVVEHQRIRAGDLLVKLDDRDYVAQREAAQANLSAAAAGIANIGAERQLQLAKIAEARADIGSAEAEAVRTQLDVPRYRALAADHVAPVQRAEQADAAYRSATAGQQKAKASLEAAERQLAVLDTEQQHAQAALDLAKANLDQAALNLGYTEIRAPENGVVGNLTARAGAYATIGAQLMAIVPADGLYVDANFKENQIAWMRSGQTATIEADALPDGVITARVGSLSPATGSQFSLLPPENATGNFTKVVQRVPVRLTLDGDAAVLGRLRPGLSVTVRVDTSARNSDIREASAQPSRIAR